jgi:hypothetical protein
MLKRALGVLLASVWLAAQSAGTQPPTRPAFAVQDATETKATHGLSRFEGLWFGSLEIGAIKWPVMLTISKNKEGTLVAIIDAPDADRTQVDSVEQTGSKLQLVVTGIGASFQGEFNATGSEIAGVWNQGRASFPLVFWSPAKKGGVIGTSVTSFSSGPQDQSKALPMESAGFQDEASFALMVNEKPMGAVKSSWAADGSFESRSTVTRSGQATQVTTKVFADKDGRWAKVIADTSLTTITVAREGGKIVRTIGNKIASWENRNNAVLLDYNSPALLSQVLRMYDRSKGGLQQFPLVEIPPRYFPQWLMVEAKETTEQLVDGHDLSLTRFHCRAGSDLDIFADTTGKIYLLELPAQNVVFVRKGYESLHSGKASSVN